MNDQNNPANPGMPAADPMGTPPPAPSGDTGMPGAGMPPVDPGQAPAGDPMPADPTPPADPMGTPPAPSGDTGVPPMPADQPAGDNSGTPPTV